MAVRGVGSARAALRVGQSGSICPQPAARQPATHRRIQTGSAPMKQCSWSGCLADLVKSPTFLLGVAEAEGPATRLRRLTRGEAVAQALPRTTRTLALRGRGWPWHRRAPAMASAAAVMTTSVSRRTASSCHRACTGWAPSAGAAHRGTWARRRRCGSCHRGTFAPRCPQGRSPRISTTRTTSARIAAAARTTVTPGASFRLPTRRCPVT